MEPLQAGEVGAPPAPEFRPFCHPLQQGPTLPPLVSEPGAPRAAPAPGLRSPFPAKRPLPRAAAQPPRAPPARLSAFASREGPSRAPAPPLPRFCAVLEDGWGAPRPGVRPPGVGGPPCSQGRGQKPLAQAPSRPVLSCPAVPGGSVASASQPRSLRTLISPEQQPQPLGPRRALPAASRRLRPMPAPRTLLPRRCLPRRSLRPACQARRPLRGAACAAGARLCAKVKPGLRTPPDPGLNSAPRQRLLKGQQLTASSPRLPGRGWAGPGRAGRAGPGSRGRSGALDGSPRSWPGDPCLRREGKAPLVSGTGLPGSGFVSVCPARGI